ncbi:MAG: hypothetical protein DMG80_12830 [Acidobacteria bacterium]|nr:MAG: hypothetical protein DMG80_12830 [Acidobacteriota bacterium]
MSGNQQASMRRASNQTKTMRKCKQDLFGNGGADVRREASVAPHRQIFHRNLFIAEATTNQGRQSNQTGAEEEQNTGLRSS